ARAHSHRDRLVDLRDRRQRERGVARLGWGTALRQRDDRQTDRHPCDREELHGGGHFPHFTVRMRPSCTTVTARAPSLVKMTPCGRPPPPDVVGVPWSYSSHSSARKGRWNHMAWSRLAIISPSS